MTSKHLVQLSHFFPPENGRKLNWNLWSPQLPNPWLLFQWFSYWSAEMFQMNKNENPAILFVVYAVSKSNTNFHTH